MRMGQADLPSPSPALSAHSALRDSRKSLVSQRPLTFSAALDDEEDKDHKEQCQ